jgi:hypothetical protein
LRYIKCILSQPVMSCLRNCRWLPHCSFNAQVLQFLCGLMALLPPQLAKLARRKAAFAAECLVPVAALAKVSRSMQLKHAPVAHLAAVCLTAGRSLSTKGTE